MLLSELHCNNIKYKISLASTKKKEIAHSRLAIQCRRLLVLTNHKTTIIKGRGVLGKPGGDGLFVCCGEKVSGVAVVESHCDM